MLVQQPQQHHTAIPTYMPGFRITFLAYHFSRHHAKMLCLPACHDEMVLGNPNTSAGNICSRISACRQAGKHFDTSRHAATHHTAERLVLVDDLAAPRHDLSCLYALHNGLRTPNDLFSAAPKA